MRSKHRKSSIAVITIVYNNYDNLDDFLNSCKKQTDKDFHVFIIDHSTDHKDLKLPDFASQHFNENGGYAYGMNAGMDIARQQDFSRFVFINDDTAVAKDFIAKAKKSLDAHPGSLIGGKIYYFEGCEYHRAQYKKSELGNVLWYAGGAMDWNHAHGVHRGVDQVDEGQYDKVEETDFITGCLMIFDDDLIARGGRMDDSYFMYFEDTDWCAQLTKKNCPLIYDPSIVIYHKNAQSTGGSGSSLHERYQRKNQLKFGLRYAPLKTKLHLVKNYFLHSIKA